MNDFGSIMDSRSVDLRPSERKIISEVWDHRTDFVQWSAEATLLWEGCVRVRYHSYPDEIKKKLKSKGIGIDSRSNGPAIMAFLFATGKRPKRVSNPNQEWHIHHIYDGRFPWPTRKETLRAVKNGKHFTQSAGLVAVHPIPEALADEYFYFTWLLRRESFLRFNYDPDIVFCRKVDKHGFKAL